LIATSGGEFLFSDRQHISENRQRYLRALFVRGIPRREKSCDRVGYPDQFVVVRGGDLQMKIHDRLIDCKALIWLSEVTKEYVRVFIGLDFGDWSLRFSCHVHLSLLLALEEASS